MTPNKILSLFHYIADNKVIVDDILKAADTKKKLHIIQKAAEQKEQEERQRERNNDTEMDTIGLDLSEPNINFLYEELKGRKGVFMLQNVERGQRLFHYIGTYVSHLPIIISTIQ